MRMIRLAPPQSHARRGRLAFGKQSGGVVVTDLFPLDASLAAHPYAATVAGAVAELVASGRKSCFACYDVFDPMTAATGSDKRAVPRMRRHNDQPNQIIPSPKGAMRDFG
jgi:hypothetical protein